MALPPSAAILAAFRAAFVADATLTALVPAADIYAGLRDEKTNIPAVDIFQVSDVSTKLAGARVGGMTKADVVMQVSVFARTDSDALVIAGRIQDIVLSDNATLNTAKIKNLTMIGGSSLREANMIHIPLRFRLNYHYTTS
jgi:hypothetical protein